jgi:hypothetical protein
MPTIEKAVAVSLCEFRLLVRSRRHALGALLLPIIAGIAFGLAGRKGGDAVTYGLYLVAAMSGILLALRPHGRTYDPAHLVKPGVLGFSRGIVAFTIMLAQSILYVILAGAIGPGALPDGTWLVRVLPLPLVAGLLIYHLARTARESTS